MRSFGKGSIALAGLVLASLTPVAADELSSSQEAVVRLSIQIGFECGADRLDEKACEDVAIDKIRAKFRAEQQKDKGE